MHIRVPRAWLAVFLASSQHLHTKNYDDDNDDDLIDGNDANDDE